jgi:NAD(P)H-dependent FMN reductase
MYSLPKIGIIIGTTRLGRRADNMAKWLLDLAQKRDDAVFELVDLRDYPMPFFDEANSPAFAPPQNAVAQRWAQKMAELDGYVFLTAEYNHSVSGVLKNALDYLFPEVQRKPAAFLGYGANGGTRAVQHLKHILGELQVASLRYAVHIGKTEIIGLMAEGKTMADYPYLDEAAVAMLNDLVWWTNTLRAGRRQEAEAKAA